MKRLLITTIAALGATTLMAQNPLVQQWDTPFGVPPFSQIENQHYIPAFKEAMKVHKAQINDIIANADAPTFENTVLAYDNAGALLDRVSSVFGCINGTEVTPELEELQRELSPLLTAHSSDIALNPTLFKRIKEVYDNTDSLDLLQIRLTEKIYKNFERNGANLSAQDKAKLRQIDTELALARLAFANNLGRDNGAFVLNVTSKKELAGLPEAVVEAAAAQAVKRNLKGWAFTLDNPVRIPFLQYSQNRALREKMFKGYIERCNNNNDADNKKVLTKIAELRIERANLLGFDTHADFTLDRMMAKNPKAVYSLLDELWAPAMKLAQSELAQMKALKGAPKDFAAWDWWYWAEKLRKQKYDLNQEELRPYFALNNVRDGIFGLTNSLYGLKFKELTSIEKYNPENQVFEVTDRNGDHLGVLYLDFHPRAGKRVGAWCTGFRDQSFDAQGNRVAPVVSIVCNFTPPTKEGEVALLNLDEVETFFHEFGHGIHALVANVPYKGLSNVERDFVELPSQIMENWAFEPQILATYARHYQTGEVIPTALVEKIERSALFNQGFATVEYLAASLLDMDYHTLKAPLTTDVTTFEKNALDKYRLMDEIAPRYRSTYFAHIFNNGYSSGYYSYIWAEVLDADAYEAFRETGNILNPIVAKQFFDEVLTKGGTADGDTLYENFRGKKPSKTPLMKNRGLL